MQITAGYKSTKLVGVERFELPTSWSQTRRATRLRYTPERAIIYLPIRERSIKKRRANLRWRDDGFTEWNAR